MLSFSLRQMTAADVFRLMAIHAMVTVTAAAFGYLAVMALRESLSAILGPKLFARDIAAAAGVDDRGARQPVAAVAAGIDAGGGARLQRAGAPQLPPMAFVGALRSRVARVHRRPAAAA